MNNSASRLPTELHLDNKQLPEDRRDTNTDEFQVPSTKVQVNGHNISPTSQIMRNLNVNNSRINQPNQAKITANNTRDSSAKRYLRPTNYPTSYQTQVQQTQDPCANKENSMRDATPGESEALNCSNAKNLVSAITQNSHLNTSASAQNFLREKLAPKKVSAFLDLKIEFKEDENQQAPKATEKDQVGEAANKGELAQKGQNPAQRRRDPLAQIENHPLLNSKSKCKSLIQVHKKYCEVGDHELPEKFKSPHSDNEELPDNGIDQKFSRYRKNFRRANSRFSEAINAIELNLQSSKISKDEILSHANKYSEIGDAQICQDFGDSVRVLTQRNDFNDASFAQRKCYQENQTCLNDEMLDDSDYEQNYEQDTSMNNHQYDQQCNQSLMQSSNLGPLTMLNGQISQPFDPNDSKYNRKEKSLGELCRRFLCYYGKQQKDLLLLDQCTKELGVEKRRIYDIINILESFCVIRRQAKNSYQWRGIDRIIYSIDAQIKQSEHFQKNQLQSVEITKQRSTCLFHNKENQDLNSQSFDQIDVVMDDNHSENASSSHQRFKKRAKRGNTGASGSVVSSQIRPHFVEIQSDEGEAEIFKNLSKDTGYKLKKYKKEKSLGILCQQFIHLFVTWKKVISLEEAAKRITDCEVPDKASFNGDKASKKADKDKEQKQKPKTKVRRLYDIANILQSIGLIKKCQAEDSKKPAFKWIGLQGTIDSVNELKEINGQYAQRKQQQSVISIQSSHDQNDSKELLNRDQNLNISQAAHFQFDQSDIENQQQQYDGQMLRQSKSELQQNLINKLDKNSIPTQPEQSLNPCKAKYSSYIGNRNMLEIVSASVDKAELNNSVNQPPMLEKRAVLKRPHNQTMDFASMCKQNLAANQIYEQSGSAIKCAVDQNSTRIENGVGGKNRDQYISSSPRDSPKGRRAGQQQSPSSGGIPPRTINEEEENELIKKLEAQQRQRLEIDPIKELDEALMDRITASQNRQHIINIQSNSNSFDSGGNKCNKVVSESLTSQENHEHLNAKADISDDRVNQINYKQNYNQQSSQASSKSKKSSQNKRSGKEQKKAIIKQERLQSLRINQKDFIATDVNHPVEIDAMAQRQNPQNISQKQIQSPEIEEHNYHTAKAQLELESQQAISGSSMFNSENQRHNCQFDANYLMYQQQLTQMMQQRSKLNPFMQLGQQSSPTISEFKNKNDWINQKSRHDLQILNQLVRPIPILNRKQSASKSVSLKKQKSQSSKSKSQQSDQARTARNSRKDIEKFQMQTMKLLGLTNMINIMWANQSHEASRLSQAAWRNGGHRQRGGVISQFLEMQMAQQNLQMQQAYQSMQSMHQFQQQFHMLMNNQQ